MSGFIDNPEPHRVSLHGEPGQASLEKPTPLQKLPESYSWTHTAHTDTHRHTHTHIETHTDTQTQKTHTHRHTHTHAHTVLGEGPLAPPHALPTIGAQSLQTCSEVPAGLMLHEGYGRSPPMSSGQCPAELNESKVNLALHLDQVTWRGGDLSKMVFL